MTIFLKITGLTIELDTETAALEVVLKSLHLVKEIIDSPLVGEYRGAWLNPGAVVKLP